VHAFARTTAFPLLVHRFHVIEKEQIANAPRKNYHSMGLDDVSFADESEVQWLCSMMAMSHPTAISIDLNSAMNLGFCQKAANDCPGFWTTCKDIWGNNGIVVCSQCQDFNWNAAKRQEQRGADKGERSNINSKVNLHYLSPTSTTERLQNVIKARQQEVHKKAKLIEEHVLDDQNKEFTNDPDTIEYIRKTLQNIGKGARDKLQKQLIRMLIESECKDGTDDDGFNIDDSLLDGLVDVLFQEIDNYAMKLEGKKIG
jgi:hypothetical protein